MIRDNLKSLIIISLIVTFALSTTYAFLNLNAVENTASGEGGCFNVEYEKGQDINQTDTPLKSTIDYSEGAHTQITLYKASDCDIYTEAEILLHTNTTSTAPLGEPFKYKILSGTTEIASGSIVENLDASGNQQDTVLATVELQTVETTYDIYLWIDSNLSNGNYNDKQYSGYLYAKSTQTSTVTGTS